MEQPNDIEDVIKEDKFETMTQAIIDSVAQVTLKHREDITELTRLVQSIGEPIEKLNENIINDLKNDINEIKTDIKEIRQLLNQLGITFMQREKDIIQSGSSNVSENSISIYDSTTNKVKKSSTKRAPTLKQLTEALYKLVNESFRSEQGNFNARSVFKELFVKELNLNKDMIDKIDISKCKAITEEAWLTKFCSAVVANIKSDPTLKNELTLCLTNKQLL